jgi:hypothetical protein
MSLVNPLKPLRFIHLAMLVSAGIFFAFVWSMALQGEPMVQMARAETEYLKTLFLLVTFGGIPLSYYIHKKKLASVGEGTGIATKMALYQNSYLVKLAILEGLAFLGLITYFMLVEKTFLLISGVFIIVLAINYPTKSKMADELQMDEAELFGDKAKDAENDNIE